jgi:hypothetical protein
VAAVMAPVAERMLTHEAGARAYVQALHDSVPGRVRFRVQGLYRHPPRCQAIEECLAGHRIVRSVTANPVTGGKAQDSQLRGTMVPTALPLPKARRGTRR